MANKGYIPGIGKDGWRDYTPEWVGLKRVGGGNPTTQPSIGSGSLRGRYILSPLGIVVATGAAVFASDTVFGSGDEWWAFGLPVPIYRWPGSSVNPMGNALLWQGTGATPSLTRFGLPSYMNAGTPGCTQGREDFFFSVAAAQGVSYGTGSIAGTATSTTITHNLGYTPAAYDIAVVATGLTAGSANIRNPFVDTITSTQFNVNVPVAPGSGKTLSFSWKIDALPGASGSEFNTEYVGSLKPWAWASGHVLTWRLIYEART